MDAERIVQEHAECATIIEHLEYCLRERDALIQKYEDAVESARLYISEGPDDMDLVSASWHNFVTKIGALDE